MGLREEAFHKWFGGELEEFKAETNKLVNAICIEATASFMAGWDAHARQEKAESPATVLAKRPAQHTQLAISALRTVLSSLPVSLSLTDEILINFEIELKQQAGA